MKNKKLLIIIAVVVVVIALIVILAVTFSVRQAEVLFFSQDGSKYIIPDADVGAPSANDVLSFAKGKSVFGLNKTDLMNSLNKKYHNFVAVGVTVGFPNKVTVYFVGSQVCAKIATATTEVYVDRFGKVAEQKEGVACVDITTAFSSLSVETPTVGMPLTFTNSSDNQRLQEVLTAISSMWRCYVDYSKMPSVFGESGVFKYDTSGNLMISVKNTATIVIKSPSDGMDLSERVIRGLSVYFKSEDNLATSGVIISVSKEGRVTTADNSAN